jgi:hypothetical protein
MEKAVSRSRYSPRAKLAAGWEVRPSFSVSQNGDRAEVLHALQTDLLRVRKHPAGPQRFDAEVGDALPRRSRRAGHPALIRYPLLSAKQLDFERFAFACGLMADGEHRSRAGLIKIVSIVRGMNPSGRRRYDADELLVNLIRDQR